MLRKVLVPTSDEITIDLPREYLNHKVEILIFPLNESKQITETKKKFNANKYNGVMNLSKAELDSDISEMRSEWDR